MRVAVCIAALATACGSTKDGPSSATEAPAPAKEPPSCKQRVAELEKFFAGMDTAMSLREPGVELVERTDLPKTSSKTAPMLSVTRDAYRFDGTEMMIDDVEVRLKAPPSYYEPGVVHVSFARDVPWSRVVEVTAVLHDTGINPLLVFAVPDTTPPPPRTKIDDDLDKLQNDTEASNKATELARLIQREVQGCPPLVRVFGDIAAVEGPKDEYMVKHVPPAIAECNCAAAPETMRSVFYRILHSTTPTHTLALELSRQAPVISAAADATWADASKRITPATKRAWLAVDGAAP